jgi:hypothetical protein
VLKWRRELTRHGRVDGHNGVGVLVALAKLVPTAKVNPSPH